MTQPDHDVRDDAMPDDDLSGLLAAFGIVVTDEGRARARRRLDAAAARWTDERWAALDAQLGADRAA